MSKVLILLFFFSPILVMAAGKKGDSFIGTSAFMLVNVNRDAEEPVDFYQLNLGYFLSDKDVLSLEFITWKYYASTDVKIGTGEQLFMTVRAGYHFQFGKSFFLQPSIAVTSWPINRGLPPTFQEKEDGTSKYIVEPGLHLGFLF